VSILTLLLTVLRLGGQSAHSIYLGGGYAYSLKDQSLPEDDVNTQTFIDSQTGEVERRRVRPRLAEGGLLSMGYRHELNQHWGWFTTFSYLKGVSWKKKRHILVSDYIWRTTRAETYRLHAGASYNMGHPRRYHRRQHWRNFFQRFTLGLAMQRSQIFTSGTSKYPEGHHSYSESRSRTVLGLGYAGFGEISLGYNLLPILYAQLSLRAEYGYYHTRWVKDLFKRSGTETRYPLHIYQYEDLKYPLHHILLNLSIGYRF
jgi:hypothetical protein